MSVEEMLKCVIISSANDAAVALAEKVGGSEEAFVAAMNERAKGPAKTIPQGNKQVIINN